MYLYRNNLHNEHKNISILNKNNTKSIYFYTTPTKKPPEYAGFKQYYKYHYKYIKDILQKQGNFILEKIQFRQNCYLRPTAAAIENIKPFTNNND